jgi:hypothetical protein
MDVWSVVVVLFFTFLAVLGAVYAYGMSKLDELKQNWVQYRCNPLYMPLAGAVGSDIFSNFTNCTMQSVQSYAGFVVDPIYQQFGMFQDVFGGMLGSIQDIRKKMGGTVDAFLGMVNSIFGKIQNTMGASLQMVGRIRTIMNRIISVFIVMLHIAVTGVKSGMSINNGPIGQVARFFCFDPFTPVNMRDGSKKHIIHINIGDCLANGEIVTSVLLLDGMNTPMVNILGVNVSANHKILYKDEWIRCGDHPTATPSDYTYPVIVCLNTDAHTIPISHMMFKDYEETDDVGEFYKDVATYYKSEVPLLRKVYRTTGFHSTTRIRMEDGTTKPIDSIDIGDRIAKGGKVLGMVFHYTHDKFVNMDEVYVAPGTLLLDNTGIHTAADAILSNGTPTWCMNLLTETALLVAVGTRDIVFLDDQEVTDVSIHDTRDKKVMES